MEHPILFAILGIVVLNILLKVTGTMMGDRNLLVRLLGFLLAIATVAIAFGLVSEYYLHVDIIEYFRNLSFWKKL